MPATSLVALTRTFRPVGTNRWTSTVRRVDDPGRTAGSSGVACSASVAEPWPYDGGASAARVPHVRLACFPSVKVMSPPRSTSLSFR